jgi:hypothetical protein
MAFLDYCMDLCSATCTIVASSAGDVDKANSKGARHSTLPPYYCWAIIYDDRIRSCRCNV